MNIGKQMKVCQILKRSAILKVPRTVFRGTYILHVGLKMNKASSVFTSKRFPVLRRKPI